MSGFSLGSHHVLESSLNLATSVSDIEDDGDEGKAEDENIRTLFKHPSVCFGAEENTDCRLETVPNLWLLDFR